MIFWILVFFFLSFCDLLYISRILRLQPFLFFLILPAPNRAYYQNNSGIMAKRSDDFGGKKELNDIVESG
jgi:hypothetical protein